MATKGRGKLWAILALLVVVVLVWRSRSATAGQSTGSSAGPGYAPPTGKVWKLNPYPNDLGMWIAVPENSEDAILGGLMTDSYTASSGTTSALDLDLGL